MFRSFPLGGQRRLEARVQATNIFNHPVFGNPQGDMTTATFGQITSIPNSNGVANWPERQIGFGVRFQF